MSFFTENPWGPIFAPRKSRDALEEELAEALIQIDHWQTQYRLEHDRLLITMEKLHRAQDYIEDLYTLRDALQNEPLR